MTTSGGSQFELYTYATAGGDPSPWNADEVPAAATDWQRPQPVEASVLVIAGEGKPDEEPIWIGTRRGSNQLRRVPDRKQALAGFQVVQRRLGHALGMWAIHPRVLLNGLPAMPFTVLAPRDALVIAAGNHTYVTERIRPYVGPPTAEMLGKMCPYCQIPIEEDTQVVTHRCGVVYHYETEESHPDTPAEDRLNCLEKIQVCLSCGHPVTLDETLVWEPEEA